MDEVKDKDNGPMLPNTCYHEYAAGECPMPGCPNYRGY